MKMKNKMTTKKFVTITKVSNDKFVRYNVNDLLKFTDFLDKNFPNWRWFNVFSKETKLQIANFTKNNRPKSRFIND
jgi:hypothetical protein